jgi:hypothetical protein
MKDQTPLDDYLTTPIAHGSMLQAQQINHMLRTDTNGQKSFGLN